MKTTLILALALASATTEARPPPRPLYPERAARPLYPEPVLACKPLFIPLCRVLYSFGGRP